MGFSNANTSSHISTSTTYVSSSGTAGTANTAMTVITRSFRKNLLKSIGDRVRIRCYFFSNTITSIIATVKVGPPGSEISVANTSHALGSTA